VRTLENYNSLQARVVIKEAAQPEKKIKPADVTGSVLDALEEKPLELKQAGLSWALAPTKFVGKRMGESPGPSAFSAEGLLSGAGIMDAPASGAAKPRDTFRQLTSPDHEFEMKNIRSRGVLHDLMLNDDVIAGYDPREVATAFNDISSISPDLIDSPGAMQAILRKRLEAGQMADFDVKQLMEMEKLRAERDKLTLESRKLEEGLI
jgi:hypothetical protein